MGAPIGNQFALGNKGGRPSEYDPAYVERAKEYIEANQDTYILGTSIKVKLPTIEGFARFLKVSVSSLHEWAKEHEVFSLALDEIKNEQKQRLLDKGLSGDYNSTIAKLILSANHGLREKTESELNVKGNLSLTSVLEAAK